MFTLDVFTIIACLFIIGAFLFAWIYVSSTEQAELDDKRKWMEQLPSVISTLGVLGTFLGITKGLVSFDTAHLDESIPVLLSGLKTAFFTSLLGMSGSLILNRIVSAKFDKEPKTNELEKAARMIVEAIKANQRELPKMMEERNKNLVMLLSKDETVRIIRQDVEQLKDDIEELKGIHQEFKSILDSISSSAVTSAEELPRWRAVATTATASISTMDNNLDEMNEVISTLGTAVKDIKDSIDDIH